MRNRASAIYFYMLVEELGKNERQLKNFEIDCTMYMLLNIDIDPFSYNKSF